MKAANLPIFAVLIDADNVAAKYAEPILKEITKFGEPALRRVYGDWTNQALGTWTETIRQQGLIAHQKSANTKGKNSTDIGLVIDAMDILHSGRFAGFVLVSSDSDFTALASRIREQGLTVIGVGEKKTPVSLRNVCNRFVLIENIIEETASTNNKTPKKNNNTLQKEALNIIKAAMDKYEQDDDWFSMSVLGTQIIAVRPDFDTRTYGHKNLSGLVRSLSNFEFRNAGARLEIKLKN